MEMLSCTMHPRLVNEGEGVMSALLQRVFSLASLGSALGAGLVGGIFFAFSNFVMPAIHRQPPSSAIATMQSINVVVLNRGFLAVFLGTGLGCLLLAGASALRWDETSSKLAIVGAIAYLVGTIGVTAGCNVPLNDALAGVAPAAADAESIWRSFYAPWMMWNHVRAVAAHAGAALMTIAILIDRARS
jgi:uncharacterized membrane protein